MMSVTTYIHYTDNGDTNNHNVKMSTSLDKIEEQNTTTNTTTTFKPPDIPLGNSYCLSILTIHNSYRG